MDEAFVLARIGAHGGPAAGQRRAAQGRSAQGRNAQGRPGQGRTAQDSAGGGQAAVPAQGRPADQQQRYDPGDPVVNVERQALKLAVQRPALCGPAFDALGPGCFTAPVHAAVFELIVSCGGTARARGGREWAEQLRAAAPDDRARGFVTGLAVEPIEAPGSVGEPDARYADEVVARVEELALSRQIAAIKSRLQRLSPVADPAEYNRIFGDLVALEGRHRALWERVPGSL